MLLRISSLTNPFKAHSRFRVAKQRIAATSCTEMKAPVRIKFHPNGAKAYQHPVYEIRWSEVGDNGRAKPRTAWRLTAREAEDTKRQIQSRIKAHGARNTTTTPEEQAALSRWREFKAANPAAPSLTALVENAITAHAIATESMTVSEAIQMRLTAAERFKRGARHLKDLRLRLGRFEQDFGSRQITSITTEEIERWLNALDGSPVTWINYAKSIGSLFTTAEKRITLPRNPMKRLERPTVTTATPELFTPNEARRLLWAADPRIVPLMVLEMFCGVRRSEAGRLTWKHLRLDADEPFVELGSDITKKHTRRNPPIPPNAAAWLRLYRGLPASRIFDMSNSTLDKLQREAAAAAGVEWKDNGMRKSFSTYRLSIVKSAAQVSEEAGNSVPMLRRYYTNVTSPETAREWFQVIPDSGHADVVQFSAAV